MLDAPFTSFQALDEQLRRLPWGEVGGAPQALIERLGLAPARWVHGGLPRIAFQLLAGLGLSGWGVQFGVQMAVNAVRGGNLFTLSYHRTWQLLAQAGLYEIYRTAFGRRPVILARLTPAGQELLTDVGVPVVENEWDRCEALHRRAEAGDQLAHTAAICLFLHHARLRGHATWAVPTGHGGRAEPDAAIAPLAALDRLLHVEVQGRGGTAPRRAAKWQNQVALQGGSAICALTPGQAVRLAAEAQLIGSPCGCLTDLTTLASTAPAGLWTHCWRGPNSPLEPFTLESAPLPCGGPFAGP